MSLRGKDMRFRAWHVVCAGLLGCAFSTALYAGGNTLPAAPGDATAPFAPQFELDAVDAQLILTRAQATGVHLDPLAVSRELDQIAAFARTLHQREERLLRRADLRSTEFTQKLESAGLPGRLNASTVSFASAILPDANPARMLRDARYRLTIALLQTTAGGMSRGGVLSDHRRDLHLYSLRNGAMGEDRDHLNALSTPAGSAIALMPRPSLFASLSSPRSLSLPLRSPAFVSRSAQRYPFAPVFASAPDSRYLPAVSVAPFPGEFA